ncbi:YoaK family protein [Streptomyces sp. NPDC059459]|uniref:YoaK family protein n=1 Tax=unclassified Streptomyces TaxID=2593676 RepID=UPI0036770A46
MTPRPRRDEERTGAGDGTGRSGAGPGREVWAARLLTFSAGAVNALGFLALGGVFTSVVTANSALVGIGLGHADAAPAVLAGLAVLGYVVGAASGGWAATVAQRRAAVADFLLLELLLLWAVAAWWLRLDGHPGGWVRTTLLALLSAAMGCQNAGVLTALGARAPTAYLTGLLTHAVADAVTGGRLRWRAPATVGLLVAGAAGLALLERWLHGVAAVAPAVLVTGAWLLWRTARAAPHAPGG